MQYVVSAAGLLLLIGLVVWLVWVRPAQPWDTTGTLVVAVQTTAHDDEGILAGLGLDTMSILQDDDEVQVSLLTRRVRLDRAQNLTVVLEQTVPIGAYTGFAFDIRSLETRPEQDGDAAITALYPYRDRVTLPAAFTVNEDAVTTIILGIETANRVRLEEDGNGTYFPVFQIETRDAAAVIRTGDTTAISGGTITESAMFGMDLYGTMRRNYRERFLDGPDGTIEEAIAPVQVLEDTEAATTTDTQTGDEEDTGATSSTAVDESTATTTDDDAVTPTEETEPADEDVTEPTT